MFTSFYIDLNNVMVAILRGLDIFGGIAKWFERTFSSNV